ncbi:MAG: hypothetical protein GY698_19240, partial [Actinomycetia bacterium]|nr:hypothetical protein [Actinomycetes bacterium]
IDTDGDGTVDETHRRTDLGGHGDIHEVDTDGDGRPDHITRTWDPDGDGNPERVEIDTDGDGTVDETHRRTDLGGHGDIHEVDTDGDGRPDHITRIWDPDGDGNPERVEIDTDGDGTVDHVQRDFGPGGSGPTPAAPPTASTGAPTTGGGGGELVIETEDDEGRVTERISTDPGTGDTLHETFGPDGSTTSSETTPGDEVLHTSYTDDKGVTHEERVRAGGERTVTTTTPGPGDAETIEEVTTRPGERSERTTRVSSDGSRQVEEVTTRPGERSERTTRMNRDGSVDRVDEHLERPDGWTVAQERDGVRTEHTESSDGSTVVNRQTDLTTGQSTTETAVTTDDFTSTTTETPDQVVARTEHGPGDWTETTTDGATGDTVTESQSPSGRERVERSADGSRESRTSTDPEGHTTTTVREPGPDGSTVETRTTEHETTRTVTRDDGSTVETRTRPDGKWDETVRVGDRTTRSSGPEDGPWDRRTVYEPDGHRVEMARNADGSVTRTTFGGDGPPESELLSSATADLVEANPAVNRVLGRGESGELAQFLRDPKVDSVTITPPADEAVLIERDGQTISAEQPRAIPGGVRFPVEYDMPGNSMFDTDVEILAAELTVSDDGKLAVEVDLSRVRGNKLLSEEQQKAAIDYGARLQRQVDEINGDLTRQGRQLRSISLTPRGDIHIDTR